MSKPLTPKERQKVKLDTPTDLGSNATRDISGALNALLADVFALYMKTKNFHWHVSGPRFRDLHLLFDEQATEIVGLVDVIAERVRKNDAPTLTSIGSISATSNIADQDGKLDADAMIKELRDDNRKLLDRLREVKETSEEAGDNATNGLVDDWIDMAEQRVWFLSATLK